MWLPLALVLVDATAALVVALGGAEVVVAAEPAFEGAAVGRANKTIRLANLTL